MPTYVYHCQPCGKSFEAVRSIQDHTRAAPPCPSCKGRKVEVVLTSFFAKTSRKS